MKIAVIGANGRSGQVFVEQALKAGYSIRAGIHHTNNLSPHSRLEVMTCDATNESDLTGLIKDVDAVVSLIGHVKGSSPDVQAIAIHAVINVIQRLSIKRLVSLTGTGVRFPGDQITLIDRLLNLGVRIIDPARVKDGRKHVEELKQSELDWTVIRVLKLQDSKPRPFILSAHGPAKLYVSRYEVAQSILQVLEENSFVRQAPIISKAKRR